MSQNGTHILVCIPKYVDTWASHAWQLCCHVVEIITSQIFGGFPHGGTTGVLQVSRVVGINSCSKHHPDSVLVETVELEERARVQYWGVQLNAKQLQQP